MVSENTCIFIKSRLSHANWYLFLLQRQIVEVCICVLHTGEAGYREICRRLRGVPHHSCCYATQSLLAI